MKIPHSEQTIRYDPSRTIHAVLLRFQPPSQILLVSQITDISSDHGCVPTPNATALVVDASDDISFPLPDYPAAAKVPRMVQLLAAVLLRSRDEEGIAEMWGIQTNALRS